jgi:hypothetical protein
VLVPTSIVEVYCVSSTLGGIKDSVNHAKYESVLFPFPLLALHGRQEENCWEIVGKKHEETL